MVERRQSVVGDRLRGALDGARSIGKDVEGGVERSPEYPVAWKNPCRGFGQLGQSIPEFPPVPVLIAGIWRARHVDCNARTGRSSTPGQAWCNWNFSPLHKLAFSIRCFYLQNQGKI